MADDLLDLERRFWTDGAAFYREHLAREVLMVFPPPAGVLDRAAVLASLDGAPRWADVALQDARVTPLSPDTTLVTYRATGTRSGSPVPYVTLASSLYVRERGRWRMAFHQQTPVGK